MSVNVLERLLPRVLAAAGLIDKEDWNDAWSVIAPQLSYNPTAYLPYQKLRGQESYLFLRDEGVVIMWLPMCPGPGFLGAFLFSCISAYHVVIFSLLSSHFFWPSESYQPMVW